MSNKLDRRKFLRGSAVAGAAALATPAIAENHTTTLKMQAAWGGGIFLENAQSYVDRVHAMAGDSLKIDLLAVDSVVKTSQMQDAVHRGVLDAAHYVPSYWYGKSKTASLFGTGPCYGWSSQEVLGWIMYGGGQELFDELMANLRLNVVSFFNSPMPAQPLDDALHVGIGRLPVHQLRQSFVDPARAAIVHVWREFRFLAGQAHPVAHQALELGGKGGPGRHGREARRSGATKQLQQQGLGLIVLMMSRQ